MMKKSRFEQWENPGLQPMFEERLNAKLRNRIAYSPCKKKWILIEEGGSYPDQGCKVLQTL